MIFGLCQNINLEMAYQKVELFIFKIFAKSNKPCVKQRREKGLSSARIKK